MEKKSFKLIGMLLMCLTLGVITSCSSKDKDLLSLASTNDTAVFTGNLQDIIDNAGCVVTADGIQPSQEISGIIQKGNPAAQENAKKALSIRGVDFKKSVLVVNKEGNTLFAIPLTDAQEFAKWVEELGCPAPAHDNGYDIYEINRTANMLVKDNTAYFATVTSDKINGNYIDDWKAEGAKAPLQKWQREALEDDDTFNGLISISAVYNRLCALNGTGANSDMNVWIEKSGYEPETFMAGYVKISTDLDDDEIETVGQLVDQNGKPLLSTNKIANVNPAMLKYAVDNAQVALLSSIPDDFNWMEMFNAIASACGGYGKLGVPREWALIASGVLSDLRGTAMFSMTFFDMTAVMRFQQFDQIHFSFAVPMVEGKAENYVSMLASTLKSFSGVKCMPDNGGYKVDYGNIIAYIKADGNNFVVSTEPITGNAKCGMPKSAYADKTSAIWVNWPKGSTYSIAPNTPLPFDATVVYATSVGETEFKGEISGTKAPLIDALIQYFSAAN